MRATPPHLCLGLAALLATAPLLQAEKEKRRPTDFAIIFQMGYGSDAFPREPEAFETVLKSVKAAHYNTILCQYDPWREELCKKHGIKIMVDLLVSDHHVYKNVEGAEKLCTSLRESDVIYAYHVWSDRMGGRMDGRSRDVANVHKWDPNHAAYVGDYGAREIGGVKDPDLVGFYDFHWKRGGLWSHLLRAREAAVKTDSLFLKYADGAPGRIGVGNYNRVLYTLSMSVACGLKGYTYHHTGAEIDKQTWQWQPLGNDLAKVNAMIAPLGPQLIKLGNPSAIYSTPVTMTAKNRPTGADPAVPAEFTAIPEEFTAQISAGEVVMGVFPDPEGREALVLANHNAYEPQNMEMAFQDDVKGIALFDREAAQWKKLAPENGKVRFQIPPAAVELLLVKK